MFVFYETSKMIEGSDSPAVAIALVVILITGIVGLIWAVICGRR